MISRAKVRTIASVLHEGRVGRRQQLKRESRLFLSVCVGAFFFVPYLYRSLDPLAADPAYVIEMDAGQRARML